MRQAEQYSCAQHLQVLEAEFGSDVLQRSAVWLTIKESRASFAIEHEEQHADRVRRFAAAMERWCGRHDDPLSEAALGELQAQILGARATRYGVRRSPVFVGEVDGFAEVVHYIAPHWDDAPRLLSGLRECALRIAGASPLVRAAVLSFGFVYIHPMSDGNGRISRFLVNDVLRRDGAVPEPFILPVSATITSSVINRRGYDQVLELFSKPLMRRYADAWRLGAEQIAEDGVHFNLQFDAYGDALPAWRYPDMTDHVEHPLKEMGFRSAQAVHYQIEAMRHAYVDRNSYLGAPDFVTNPLERLLSKDYAAKVRRAIASDKAGISKDIKPGVAPHDGSNTTYYSIVDKWGNAVSVTYTLNDWVRCARHAGRDRGALCARGQPRLRRQVQASGLRASHRGSRNK